MARARGRRARSGRPVAVVLWKHPMDRNFHGMDWPKHPMDVMKTSHGKSDRRALGAAFSDKKDTACAVQTISCPLSAPSSAAAGSGAAVNGNGAWRAGVKNGCCRRKNANKTKSGACTRRDEVCRFTSLHISFAPRALSLFLGTLPPPAPARAPRRHGHGRPHRAIRKRLPPRWGKQPPCVKL